LGSNLKLPLLNLPTKQSLTMIETLSKLPPKIDPKIPPKAMTDPTQDDPSSSIPNPGSKSS
jgi:hypothetical protein